MNQRWAKEEEERKRKAEEEEENRFDYTSYLLETRKPIGRKVGKPSYKGKAGVGGAGSSKAGGIGSRQAKLVGAQMVDGISKRKTGMTKR